MNLIIDIGNTLIKLAVFQNNKLIYKKISNTKNAEKEAKAMAEKHKSIKKAIVSAVGNSKKYIIDFIDKQFDTIHLSNDTKLPFENTYKTPKTLGVDRIALVSAAVEQYPKKNVLIIDAGTCITYDFITKTNTYLGGAISPGIRLRYQSLHDFTANLPLLEIKMPKKIIGTTTATSIHSGVILGILKEIDGIIDDYREQYADLTVILTGGDANFLSKKLKNTIFANSNFLLEGLNFILEINSK